MTSTFIEPHAIESVRRGGLIIFPTETIYGLGCDALNEAALQRLFEVKGRAPDKPPPVLVAGEAQLQRLVREISPLARDLMQRFWPGALTIVLPARYDIPTLLTGIDAAGRPTIAVRHSAHAVAAALVEAAGVPIVATSANFAGATGPAATPGALNEVDAALRNAVDTLLDGDKFNSNAVAGQPSTIIDCTTNAPRLLREGAISWQDICET